MKTRIVTTTTLALITAMAFASSRAAYAAPPPEAPAAPAPTVDPAAAGLADGDAKYAAGDYPGALAAYRRFLAAPPPKLAASVPQAVARVEEIQAIPGKVHVETNPPGATVTIDGAQQAQPSPLDVSLPPGKHLLRATAPGRDALEREIDVGFASSDSVSLHLAVPAPVAAPPAPVVIAPTPPLPQEPTVFLPATPPPEPPVTRRTVAFAAAGVAVVGAAVGTVFGILALNNKSAYQRNPTYANSDNGNNDAAYADGGAALAIAAGITSLVLYLTSGVGDAHDTSHGDSGAVTPKKQSPALSASPLVNAHGGGAGALLCF